MYVKTLIIGSGFSGRTVASYLGDHCLLIDRGEKLDHAEVVRKWRNGLGSRAFESALPWNKFSPLSSRCNSYYPMIAGGASNEWGGNSRRLPQSTFDRRDAEISWPLSYKEMLPWYEKAEIRLNLTGDPAYNPSRLSNTTPGFEQWRYALRPYFNSVGLSSIAINTGKPTRFGQGVCVGRSDCVACYEDAKARPDNIFDEMQMLLATQCLEIKFEGPIARSAVCYNGREVFEIEFDRCVVAANGIESAILLQRSELPSGVRVEKIGRYFQDHTHIEIQCFGEFPLPYNSTGAFGHVYLDDLAGEYFGIEVSCFAITHISNFTYYPEMVEQTLNYFDNVENSQKPGTNIIELFFELEMLPFSEMFVTTDENGLPTIEDSSFVNMEPVYDRVVNAISEKILSTGLRINHKKLHYKEGYGGHHFAGTLNMGTGENAVCDINAKVIGTENLYIAGTGLIPRSGGEGPTLTAVALAERLGTYLFDMEAKNE
jgi:glucose dehydrogenase